MEQFILNVEGRMIYSVKTNDVYLIAEAGEKGKHGTNREEFQKDLTGFGKFKF